MAGGIIYRVPDVSGFFFYRPEIFPGFPFRPEKFWPDQLSGRKFLEISDFKPKKDPEKSNYGGYPGDRFPTVTGT